jgi:hypothetical protein
VLTFRAEHGDGPGAGNFILEVLFSANQLVRPSAVARAMPGAARAIVSRMFGIPEFLTYKMPLRDEQISAESRGSWAGDVFHQTAIYAYLMGATWRTLPKHFDQAARYYSCMAEVQKMLIHNVATSYRSRPPSPEEARRKNVEEVSQKTRAIVVNMLDLQCSSDAIARQVAAELHPASPTDDEDEDDPLTPENCM